MQRTSLVTLWIPSCLPPALQVCAARMDSGAYVPHTEADHTFTVPYDVLLCSVGAVSATFGTPGVHERCYFLKSMEDARKLRKHIRWGGRVRELSMSVPCRPATPH